MGAPENHLLALPGGGADPLPAGRGGTGLGPWLLALLAICGAMLAAGYLYHVTAGGDSVAFDVGLYVLLMGAGFLLAGGV